VKSVANPHTVLALGVILLLAFWITRLLAIDVFPPFIDEMLHVHVSERAAQQSPFVQADLGRLLTIWWHLIFRSYAAAPIWIARAATVLAVLPGVAAAIGLGRLAAGLWGALLAGLLYLFSAYHQFYERLALADPLSGAALSLALYFAYRLARRADLRDAAAAGIALYVAFLAKVTALPYLGIPLAAALTLRPAGRTWREQGRWLAVALIIPIALIGVTVVGLRLREYDLLTNSLGYALSNRGPVEAGEVFSLSRIADNIARTFDVLAGYTGVAAAGLLLAAVIVLAIRRRLYLPLCLLAPLALVWLSRPQTSRYLLVPMTILLLCGAVALANAVRRRGRAAQVAALGLVLLWGAAQWLPFAWTAARTPLDIPLPPGDYEEYVLSDAAGFGLAEARDYLRPLAPREVLGLLSNCQGLRYLSWQDFPVTCQRVSPNGEDIPTLAALMDQRRAAGVYVVLEDSPYVPAAAPGRLLTVIERPGGRANLAIYDLAP